MLMSSINYEHRLMGNKTKLQPNLIEVELWLSLAVKSMVTCIQRTRIQNLRTLAKQNCGNESSLKFGLQSQRPRFPPIIAENKTKCCLADLKRPPKIKHSSFFQKKCNCH